MPRSALTGTRIRDERLRQGIRQGQLAHSAGISASYLNLIEHNKRRIGGKVLLNLSRALSVEPASLTEGAEAGVLAELQTIFSAREMSLGDQEDISEFATRFPAWAQALVEQAHAIRDLERNVQTLTDRLTHDPFLSTSLHDVLSSATSIRSTAAILADTTDIDPDWSARFLRNIRDDSHRLGDGAAALARYLDGVGAEADIGNGPQDELEAYLKDHDYRIPALEAEPAPDVTDFADEIAHFSSASTRAHAAKFFARYVNDAAALPAKETLTALEMADFDPAEVSRQFQTPLSAVLRRWASLAGSETQIGLVQTDMSGAVTFRKPLEGFPLPRFGDVCALWPVFEAVTRPHVPIARKVSLGEGAAKREFQTYSISEPIGVTGFDQPQILQSTMLFLPVSGSTEDASPVQAVGTTCRICPVTTCPARREPSILFS